MYGTNLGEQRGLQSKAGLMQRRLNQSELLQVQQGLIQPSCPELLSLAFQRARILPVESVYRTDPFISEKMLQRIAPKPSSRPSDKDNILPFRTIDQVGGTSREVRRVLLDILPQICGGMGTMRDVAVAQALVQYSKYGARQ